MTTGRSLYKPCLEGEMVGRKVPGVSDDYHFERLLVQS